MKRISICIIIFLSGLLQVGAQILNPIHWSYSQQQKNDSTVILQLTAKMDPGHHLYSQFTPEGGPLPTIFDFKKSSTYKLIGKASEPKPFEEFDELFGVKVKTFKTETVVFKQEVRIFAGKPFEIAGEISGMTCDDKGCTPFDQVLFSFQVPGRTIQKNSVTAIDTTDQKNAPDAQQTSTGTTNTGKAGNTGACKDLIIEGLNAESSTQSHESYWLIFLLGFGGGLVALLTPCVFPMIPLTVSFFTKSSSNRRKGLLLAIAYGLSIAAIYTLIAVPFILFKIPPDTLNEIATSAWLNMLFFVIFVVFSISFFGYFEITLPASLANKADSASNIGGLLGVFFMAITLALVSFSCTGPILGSFLAGTLATNPDPYNILFVMLGFGVALGLPFALFAAFPAWLNSLPKSGGWLNSVKVVLGFLELGMALKFLSNADLVEQWGFLKRETFLIIWALLAFGLALYLLGIIRFPHDSKVKKFGIVRLGLSLFFAVSGVYFTTGVFGSNLELISGFPPPSFYSYSNQNSTENKQVESSHCPQGIPCEHDFEEAKLRSVKENKPILIDFTGWACVNCRRMEEGVWTDPEVKKLMSEKFILVSLYVDEKASLPESEKFKSCITGKEIRTVGNKWSNMQFVNFKSNSQPQYVMLSPDGKLISQPIGYSTKSEYLEFLKKAIN